MAEVGASGVASSGVVQRVSLDDLHSVWSFARLEDLERDRQHHLLLRHDVIEGEAAVVGQRCVPLKGQRGLMGSGPDDSAADPPPSEGRREIHLTDEPLLQGFCVLDPSPQGAEINEEPSQESKAGPGEMPRDGEPCLPSTVSWLIHEPLL